MKTQSRVATGVVDSLSLCSQAIRRSGVQANQSNGSKFQRMFLHLVLHRQLCLSHYSFLAMQASGSGDGSGDWMQSGEGGSNGGAHRKRARVGEPIPADEGEDKCHRDQPRAIRLQAL